MKRAISWVLLCMVLAACSSERMIQIDSEVQATLDYKKSLSRQPQEDTPTDDTTPTPTAWIQANMDELAKLPEDVEMTFDDYVPAHMNEVKIFSDGNSQYETYVDFAEDTTNEYQMSERFETDTTVKIYKVSDTQLIQQASYKGPYFLDDKLSGTNETSVSKPRVVLQSPLRVGSEWSAYDNYTSKVTALYESVMINGAEYQGIVEVTTALEEHTLKEYYAQQVGLIATRILLPDNDLKAQWQLMERYSHAQMTEIIPTVEPRSQYGHDLQWGEDILSHQTNETMEQSFTKLLQEKQWISPSIVVNRLFMEQEGTLVVDFSPGVVAAMNAHETREEGIIPAIVETLGRYFGVSNVKLTVNGQALLPDRLPYPTGGTWRVNEH